MSASLERPAFATRKEYARRLCDVAYWRPYVQAVWARSRLGTFRTVRAPLPGTYPTFVVDDRLVVKFFGRRFNGARAFAVERHVQELIRRVPEIPGPVVVGEGALFERGSGWHWPYLLTQALPGRSLTEVADRVSWEGRLAAARFLADVARRLHGLTPEPVVPELRPTWESFAALLARRRREFPQELAGSSGVPPWFVAQAETFVEPVEHLIDSQTPPVLLHADLTADHVLGQFRRRRWVPTGVIDFGDARMGDRLYELVSLHLDCFRGHKRLLAAFLEQYGLDETLRRDFARRAMCMTILHEFFAAPVLFRMDPALREAGSLDELARLLWDLDAPGIGGQ